MTQALSCGPVEAADPDRADRDAGFLRVYRFYLVALSAVTALRPVGAGHVIVLGNGPGAMRVPVSRRQVARVRRLLRDEPDGRRSA